jgi:hypothetical protein
LPAVEQPSRTHRDNFAALRLLLGGVRQNDAAGSCLLGFDRLNNDAIV